MRPENFKLDAGFTFLIREVANLWRKLLVDKYFILVKIKRFSRRCAVAKHKFALCSDTAESSARATI